MLVRVKFNEKLITGYEKDETGALKTLEGKVIPIEAYVIDWAVEKNRELFYNNKHEESHGIWRI